MPASFNKSLIQWAILSKVTGLLGLMYDRNKGSEYPVSLCETSVWPVHIDADTELHTVVYLLSMHQRKAL